MALIECPKCRANIGDTVSSCPECGHPITKQNKWTFGQIGVIAGLSILVLFGLGLGVARVVAHKEDGANSTCKSDWRKCSDNADLINNFSGVSYGRARCLAEAKARAKFGAPKFSSPPFGTFRDGNDYVKTGVAIMVEKDAQFQNAPEGPWVQTNIVCKYDLADRQVLVLEVAVGK